VSKKGLLVCLTMAVAALCVASAVTAAPPAKDSSLARVQKAGKIVICSSNDVPYSYKDPKSGQLTGTDIDMLRYIAAQIGVKKLQLYVVPISGIIPALLSKRCDLISDNIAITLKRSQQIAFSNPEYQAGQALVVPKGNPAHIQTEADFHGHTVGSYLGTIQLDYLQQLAAKDSSIKVKAYKDIPEIIADLKAGRLDGALFDGMVAAYSLRVDPNLSIEVLSYHPPIGDYAVGMGFRKQDVSLRLAIDEANRKMETTGALTSILKKWNLTPFERYYPFPNCCS
jgi:polar amino acid transport system substrate-binding protein